MSAVSGRSGFMAGGALLAGTLLVAGLNQDATSQARAGTCVDKDAQPTACYEAAAVYQVLTTVPTDEAACPDGDYVEKRAGADLLCLGYNVAAGDCVQDDPGGPALVRCTTDAPTPTIRILKVVEDRASAKACRRPAAAVVRALTYAEPATTVCIVHLPLGSAAT